MSDKDTWYCKGLGVKIPPVAELTDFFETYCLEEIITLVESYPNIIEDYPEGGESSEGEEFPKDKGYPEKKTIHIKYPDLYKFSRGLGTALINHFYDTTKILQKALANVKVIRGSNKEINLDEIEFSITDIPNHLKTPIRELGTKHIGKLVCLDGLVKSVSVTTPKNIKAAFECLRCGM